MNPSMILTPMKTLMVIIKPIKRKCERLRTNKRLILLHNFFKLCWIQISIACTFMSHDFYAYHDIMRLGLKVVITTLEVDFFNSYCDGDLVFYI